MASLTDREKVMAASRKAQTSFDQTCRESLDRIEKARTREQKLEEALDSFIKAAARAWEALKQLLAKVWKTMQPLLNRITEIYQQKERSSKRPDKQLQQRIQQEHHDQAKLTVSIYELHQHRQLTRHSSQRRK